MGSVSQHGRTGVRRLVLSSSCAGVVCRPAP
jgi:hypothetical protein